MLQDMQEIHYDITNVKKYFKKICNATDCCITNHQMHTSALQSLFEWQNVLVIKSMSLNEITVPHSVTYLYTE